MLGYWVLVHSPHRDGVIQRLGTTGNWRYVHTNMHEREKKFKKDFGIKPMSKEKPIQSVACS